MVQLWRICAVFFYFSFFLLVGVFWRGSYALLSYYSFYGTCTWECIGDAWLGMSRSITRLVAAGEVIYQKNAVPAFALWVS